MTYALTIAGLLAVVAIYFWVVRSRSEAKDA